MNKQEVLEELETTSTQFFHVATSTGVEANNKTLSTGVFAGLGIAKSVLTKLEEPQKVKVPKCVGELLDYYRNSTDVDLLALLITFKNWYCRKDKAGENENAIDWLVKHPEKYMRAWLDGYEVEEEPKWVVKVGNLYFCGWEDTTAQFVMNTVLGEDESIIKYKNEGTASSVAKNLGGTVEKV
ncbi:DUF1642 domain-containing protein [Enterococcus avium]|uniref:DUF1642 domain-containing protein n=1 Tax=Enterococcus avium TaxID=33945 RepID=UPI0032E376B9